MAHGAWTNFFRPESGQFVPQWVGNLEVLPPKSQ